MKVADEPGGKEIEPMSMCCAAMDAEDRRAASRAIIQVMQSRSANLDKMIGVGGRLEASLGSLNTFLYIVSSLKFADIIVALSIHSAPSYRYCQSLKAICRLTNESHSGVPEATDGKAIQEFDLEVKWKFQLGAV